MFSVLANLNIDFKIEKYFKWCKFVFNGKNYTGRYDFYFIHNNQEYVVEMDGGFHFCDNKMTGQTKEDSNNIDSLKEKLAIEHNILPIRINCKKSELEYIKSEILKSNLNNVFDLSKMDWQECQKQSLTSLKLQACDLWNNHYNIKTISEKMKRDKNTTVRWLKSCAEAGLCDYIAVLEKGIVCYETNEFFKSITDASKKHKVSPSMITWNINGKNKLPCKLNWRYATEEEKLLNKVGDYY